MKLGNNLDQREKKDYVILVFIEKKFISKDMKVIDYKMKKLNRFVFSSKGSRRDLPLHRTSLTSTKRASNMTKIKN